ncbi:MAG: 3-deoxy-manno-octulosonate cytidylyltransferase [Thermoanaerobaculia bacterium]|nr:MAG: 3-deoxy-manno-octulosonate cytidylyltransferase [Thermoanaerobaculia bacterium]
MVAAIPARWGSTRLPGKALLQLAGRPMVEHVWRRARRATGLARVVVLTDHERVAEAVAGFGGEVEMTPAECASGTDRIAWAARSWDCDGVINIQGDEPLIDPGDISRLADHLAGHPEDPIATLATAAEPGDRETPSAVKVVLDRNGYALYFSRAAIPYPRNPGGAPAFRHLGIYGYQKGALLALAGLAPSPLEVAESLEQLRALENGMRIRVLTGAAPSWGVDTAEDARAMAGRLAAVSDSGGRP